MTLVALRCGGCGASLRTLVCSACGVATPYTAPRVMHSDGCPAGELDAATRRGDEAEVARLTPVVKALAGSAAGRPS